MSTLTASADRHADDFRDVGSFLVIGAGGGIGSALCRALTERGASVIAAGRSVDRLSPLAAEIDTVTTGVDATDFDDVDRCVAEACGRDGGLAGAVCCVGSILLKPAHLTTAEQWDEVIRLNLTSAFALVRAAGKHMTGSGSVVLVSSVAASIRLGNHEAIAAAKGGVESLVRAAAASYSARGLRFNAVSPGLVETPLSHRLTSSPAAREASERMHPLGRIGKPEDIASAITWLLDPSNSWVTGQIIGVDGGLGAIRPK